MFLICDTETTGLKKNTDRIVEIAWVLVNRNGKKIKEKRHLIYPNGFQIPPRATYIHKISTAEATKHGNKLDVVLSEFIDDVRSSDAIICHNAEFDIAFLRREMERCKLPKYEIDNIDHICTMKLATQFCGIKKFNGKEGFKRPTLMELYYKCFGNYFEHAHSALADANATAKCFNYLCETGIIIPRDRSSRGVRRDPDVTNNTAPTKRQIVSDTNIRIEREENETQETVQLFQDSKIETPQAEIFLKFETTKHFVLNCQCCRKEFSVTMRRGEDATRCPNCTTRVPVKRFW